MKWRLLAVVLLFTVPAFSQILNIEAYRINTDTTGWAGQTGFNFSLTKNTKTLINIGNDTHVQYKTLKHLILFLGKYNLLLSDDDNLIDKTVLHLRYNYFLTPKLTAEAFVQGQRNVVSNIDFRGLAGWGLRIKCSANPEFPLFLGSTLMYEHEETTLNTTQDLWRWSNYISLTYKQGKQFSFVNTTYFQPAFEDFSDYRLSSQNSLIFLISEHLRFKSVFNLYYDSKPVVGIPNTQYQLTSGLVYKF